MVEIEEITDNNTKEEAIKASDTIKKPAANTQKIPKGKKLRKDLPSVAHMLAHGSPESQGRPKSFCDVFGYPIFVAICFAISLLIFHYAPHEKSVQPRNKYSLPKQNHYKKVMQTAQRRTDINRVEAEFTVQSEKIPDADNAAAAEETKETSQNGGEL